MSNRRGVLLGATFMSFGNVVRIGLQLVSIPLLARLLGPGVYGLVAFAMAIISFASVLCETGLSGAIARGAELTQRMSSTVFWLTLSSGLGFALIVNTGAVIFSLFYPKTPGAIVIMALSPVLVASAMLALPSGLVIRQQKFWAFATSDIVSVTLSSVTAIALAAAGAGIWSLVAQSLVLTGTKLIILYAISRPSVSLSFNVGEIRSMISFGVDNVFSNVATFISRTIDNIIIGAFLGPTNLGLYSMSYQISWMPDAVLSGPVYASIIPIMGRKSGDQPAMKTLFLSSFSLVTAIVIPTFVGLALTADLTVPLFLGPKWLPAVTLLPILSVAGCMNCLFSIVTVSLLAAGHSRDQLFLTLYVAGVVIATVLVGLLFGVNGVAIAIPTASVIAAPMFFERAYTRFGVIPEEFGRRLILPLGGAVLMALAVIAGRLTFLSTLPPPLALPAVVSIGAAVYVAFVALFGRHVLLQSLHEFRRG